MASINPDEKTDLTTWLKMVEQLRHAPEWPEDELPIEMKQTHISVLLLSRSYVIKLKKPVDFGFLDSMVTERGTPMATTRGRTISPIGWGTTTSDTLFTRKPIEVMNLASACGWTIKRGTAWVLKSDISTGMLGALSIWEFRRMSRILAPVSSL